MPGLLEGKLALVLGIANKWSLAYAIAQRRLPTSGGRTVAMATPAFQAAFAEAQRYLGRLNVAFIAIENPLELYLFEAYAAMSLATHEWNTFRTH